MVIVFCFLLGWMAGVLMCRDEAWLWACHRRSNQERTGNLMYRHHHNERIHALRRPSAAFRGRVTAKKSRRCFSSKVFHYGHGCGCRGAQAAHQARAVVVRPNASVRYPIPPSPSWQQQQQHSPSWPATGVYPRLSPSHNYPDSPTYFAAAALAFVPTVPHLHSGIRAADGMDGCGHRPAQQNRAAARHVPLTVNFDSGCDRYLRTYLREPACIPPLPSCGGLMYGNLASSLPTWLRTSSRRGLGRARSHQMCI